VYYWCGRNLPSDYSKTININTQYNQHINNRYTNYDYSSNQYIITGTDGRRKKVKTRRKRTGQIDSCADVSALGAPPLWTWARASALSDRKPAAAVLRPGTWHLRAAERSAWRRQISQVWTCRLKWNTCSTAARVSTRG